MSGLPSGVLRGVMRGVMGFRLSSMSRSIASAAARRRRGVLSTKPLVGDMEESADRDLNSVFNLGTLTRAAMIAKFTSVKK